MKDEKLLQIINDNKASLISVLQGVQKEYGYLSFDNLKYVSETLDISLEEIYSVATFYNAFKFKPKAKYEINVCMGTACYIKGAEKLFNKVKEMLNINLGEMTKDGKFALVETRCIGACGLAPVFKINDEVYGKATPEMIEKILKEYIESR